MKVVDNPTIELEEKDIETIKGIYKLIKDMPCSSLFCGQCPFSTICDFVITGTRGDADTAVLTIQKALSEAIIK